MNNQFKEQKNIDVGNENLISNLSAEISSLLSKYEIITENEFVYEKNNDLFKSISNKAKASLEYTNEKFDKEKLCYMIAVYILRSGLYYVLERAYKNGFDFEDL